MVTDYDPTDKTPLMPGGGDNDNDDDEWRDVDLSHQPVPEEDREQWRFPTDTDPNTTNPFEPGASSTPSGGENIPMATRLPTEKQGARGGTAETSFTTEVAQDKPPLTKEEMLRQEVVDQFPHVSWTELEFRYKEAERSGGLIIEVKYHTAKDSTWMPLLIKSRGDVNKTLNQSLANRIKDALGKPKLSSKDADDGELDQTNAALQEFHKQEAAQLKALH